MRVNCQELDPKVVIVATLQLMNCALRQLGRQEVCSGVFDLAGCVSSLPEAQFSLYNSYYIHFRNACAYLKMLALERNNSQALTRISKLHKYMQGLMYN